MKVVIDTNVLVSAILKDRDPETVILFVAEHDDMEWIVSPEIMTEYLQVLSRPKFGLPQETQDAWFSLLDRFTVSCPVDLAIDFHVIRKMPSSFPAPLLAVPITSLPVIVTFARHKNSSTTILFRNLKGLYVKHIRWIDFALQEDWPRHHQTITESYPEIPDNYKSVCAKLHEVLEKELPRNPR